MTKALTGNHVPLSTSSIKPISTSLALSVPAHTVIHIALTWKVKCRCPLIEPQGTRTMGIMFCGHGLQMLSSSQFRQRQLLHHSRSTRLTIYSEYHEKMICNKSNKPTFHSKKLRHFLKICHTYIVANYVFEVQWKDPSACNWAQQCILKLGRISILKIYKTITTEKLKVYIPVSQRKSFREREDFLLFYLFLFKMRQKLFNWR